MEWFAPHIAWIRVSELKHIKQIWRHNRNSFISEMVRAWALNIEIPLILFSLSVYVPGPIARNTLHTYRCIQHPYLLSSIVHTTHTHTFVLALRYSSYFHFPSFPRSVAFASFPLLFSSRIESALCMIWLIYRLLHTYGA